MQAKKLTMQRLMKEESGLDKQPIPNAIVTRKGLLNFHFCLHSLEGPYAGGYYHGVIELHQNYPFAAPKLIFFTPSGRFDVNMPICTSFTNYHQESWTSAWNVRTLVLATISFMYSEQPSYGCRQDSNDQRIKMAKSSLEHNLKNAEFVQLFGQKLEKMGISTANQLKQCQQEKEQKKIEQQNYIDYVQEQIINADGEQLQPQELIERPKRQRPKRNNRELWKVIAKGICCVAVVGVVVFVAYKVQ